VKETIKKNVLSGLHLISSFFPLSLLRAITRQRHIIPFYHVVSDNYLPHVAHLYAVKNSQQFVDDLDFFCRHFTPISFQQLIDAHYHDKKLPKNSFLLTFDDGLAECHTVIAPILKRKGIPAVFFLNAAFVDNQALMFRYKASLLIDYCLKHRVADKLIASTLATQSIPFHSISDTLLAVQWSQRSVLDVLAKKVGISFNDFLEKQQPYLTTAQIKSMQKDGFVFGSHSINHPRYYRISEEERYRQTLEGHQRLSQQLDFKHRTFAFPFTDFGLSANFIQSLLSEHHFTFTFGGAGLKHEKINRQLQRIAMESDRPLTARQLLNTAYCYYIIKAIFAKNTIHR